MDKTTHKRTHTCTPSGLPSSTSFTTEVFSRIPDMSVKQPNSSMPLFATFNSFSTCNKAKKQQQQNVRVEERESKS
jgi:hypothetical protein